jgi:DNA helicase HerA-like ATPase
MTSHDHGADAAAAHTVGQVLGTEDATPLMFHVAITPEATLQLDDVVTTTRTLPDGERVTNSGIVTQVRARHEGASFGSDVFLISDGVLPARMQETAEITTTRVDPERYVPPLPGEVVHRATGAARAQALYFDQMERRVPVGRGRDGETLFVNMDFIDGSRGAHVSISGVSGVATKTSFALFLLHSIFGTGGVLPAAHNVKALIFSVKGEDLLFLDKANIALSRPGGEEIAARYSALGLRAEPFASVSFFAPPHPGPSGRPQVTGRTEGVDAFWWTLAEFCSEQLLPYVFTDSEDDRAQYTMVVHQVTQQLLRNATAAGSSGAISLGGGLIATYADLVDVICEKVVDVDGNMRDWAGPAIGIGTANAFVRRLRSSVRALAPIVRGDLTPPPTRRISTGNQQVTVVDLHNLPERAQRFVVGVVLAAETAAKEAAGPGSLLFTMLDELNKYAPREGSSPIKDVLLDIAERGRSLGIILIGAQQTASEVERRIISNSSIRVVGRLDAAEAARPEYGFLPQSQRTRATIAKPGTMFVSQPEIPVPLALDFPFPAWATRPSEVDPARAGRGAAPAVDPADAAAVFAGLPLPDDPPF